MHGGNRLVLGPSHRPRYPPRADPVRAHGSLVFGPAPAQLLPAVHAATQPTTAANAGDVAGAAPET